MSRSKFSNQQLEELRSKGYSPVEIAQELGVNKSTISRRLKSRDKQTDNYKFYGTVKAEKKLNISFDEIREARMILRDVRKDVKIVHKIIQENFKRKERYLTLSKCVIRKIDIDGRILNLMIDEDNAIYECIVKESQFYGKDSLLEFDKIILKATELLKKILKKIDFLESFEYEQRMSQIFIDIMLEEMGKIDENHRITLMERLKEIIEKNDGQFGENGYICN